MTRTSAAAFKWILSRAGVIRRGLPAEDEIMKYVLHSGPAAAESHSRLRASRTISINPWLSAHIQAISINETPSPSLLWVWTSPPLVSRHICSERNMWTSGDKQADLQLADGSSDPAEAGLTLQHLLNHTVKMSSSSVGVNEPGSNPSLSRHTRACPAVWQTFRDFY